MSRKRNTGEFWKDCERLAAETVATADKSFLEELAKAFAEGDDEDIVFPEKA